MRVEDRRDDSEAARPPPIRQDILGVPCDEGVGLGTERGRQHPVCPVTSNFGQRVIYRFRLTKGK